MQADNEDRQTTAPGSAGIPVVPIAVIILVIIAIAYWYLGAGGESDAPPPPPSVEPAVPAQAPVPAELEPAPDIPEADTAPPPEEPDELPPPPPPLTLEESDPEVRAVLQPEFDDTLIAPALDESNLIERSAALIDLTRQGRVDPKLFPIPRPTGKFTVIEEGEELYLDPASYERYNAYAQTFSELDAQLLVETFHRFRPLLEEAWAALGYRAEDLDNNLIRALDQVIAAPVLEQPPGLVKDVTTYNFTDENLEALSPLAKQLIRMGPDNQALVQAQAKALREALLNPR